MTPDDAAHLAEAEARRLGFPWDARTARATRRHLWPFPATWRVVSRVEEPRAVTTMLVSERRGAAVPIHVIYPAAMAALRRPLGTRLGRRLVFPALLGGGLAYLLAAVILRWPRWIAILLAVAWAILSPILLASARAERAVDMTQK